MERVCPRAADRRDWLEVPLPPPEKRLQAPRGGRGPQNNSRAGASPRGSQDKHREDPRTSSSASAARHWSRLPALAVDQVCSRRGGRMASSWLWPCSVADPGVAGAGEGGAPRPGRLETRVQVTWPPWMSVPLFVTSFILLRV